MTHTEKLAEIPSENTQALVARIHERENLGLRKYGVTLDRNDLSANDWIQHAQDEALDLSAYLEGLKRVATDLHAENDERAVQLITAAKAEGKEEE